VARPTCRRIAGLPSEAVTEIGDALVDAGLITGDGPKLPLAVGKCRVCGCTERDCRLCAERQGYECCWMDFDRQDLCSACAPLLEVEVCSILPHPIGKQLDDAGYMTVGSLYGKVPEEICGIAGLKPKSLLKALSVVEEWVRGQLTRTVEGDALPDMTGDLAPVEG